MTGAPGAADTDLQPRFVEVASLADVPPGWVRRVRAGSRDVALANCDGALFALDNTCPHAGGPLGDGRLKDGCYVECPWHNSVFEARTGEALRGPARKPVKMYPVTVQDGTVFVAVD
jgi:nitrite reductase/ring-hydroxylating ferredoxin subunit